MDIKNFDIIDYIALTIVIATICNLLGALFTSPAPTVSWFGQVKQDAPSSDFVLRSDSGKPLLTIDGHGNVTIHGRLRVEQGIGLGPGCPIDFETTDATLRHRMVYTTTRYGRLGVGSLTEGETRLGVGNLMAGATRMVGQ